MPQPIPHFVGTDVIGDYKMIADTINFPEAPYRVKDLPDIADLHLNQGSICNVVSIQIKVEFVAIPSSPPSPNDGAGFSFDHTWTRDDFVAVDLNGIYRYPSSLTDQHSEPTQVSPKKKTQVVNGVGNNWRRPRARSSINDPVVGYNTERCQVIFFGDDGYEIDGSLYAATMTPYNKNLLSVSTPPALSVDRWTLTRFQDLISTRIFIWQPQINNLIPGLTSGFFQVYNLSHFFAAQEGYFSGIQEGIWIQSGNLEVYGSSDLGLDETWFAAGTVRKALRIVREAVAP